MDMQKARGYSAPVFFINKNIFYNKIVFAEKGAIRKSPVGYKKIYENNCYAYDA